MFLFIYIYTNMDGYKRNLRLAHKIRRWVVPQWPSADERARGSGSCVWSAGVSFPWLCSSLLNLVVLQTS